MFRLEFSFILKIFLKIFLGYYIHIHIIYTHITLITNEYCLNLYFK